MLEARGAIVTTWIAMTTTMHTAAVAQIVEDNKDIKDHWRDNKRHRHQDAMPCNNQQMEDLTRGRAAG